MRIKNFLYICFISVLLFALLTCSIQNSIDSDNNNPPSTAAASEIKLATWNIRILSTGSRDDAELTKIAEIIKRYDLVAIQETRDTTVLNRLKNMLPGYTYIASDPVESSVKEIYTYFYKDGLISVIGTPYIYVEDNNEFLREPYIACFKAGNFDFTLINIHVIYGDSVSDRRAEVSLLDNVISQVQKVNSGEKDIILLGDFNLESDDFAWQITTHQALVDPSNKTTITDTSSYDNIWINTAMNVEYDEVYEIYRFDELTFSNDDDVASLAVSDHRPVAIVLRTDLSDDDSGTGCGTPNNPGSQQRPPDVRIYSVTATPTAAEQVTLKNYPSFTADISFWTLGDLNNPTAYRIPNNTTIIPDGTKTFPRSTLGFGINDSGETIYLKNDEGDTIDTWSN